MIWIMFCAVIAVLCMGFMILAWAGDLYDKRIDGTIYPWRMDDIRIEQLRAEIRALQAKQYAALGNRALVHPESTTEWNKASRPGLLDEQAG